MGFTFKKEPKETGLAGVARPYQDVLIKLKGKQVGIIAAPNFRIGSDGDKWEIRFVVKAENHCGWKWVTLKARQEDEQAARDFIKKNTESFLKFDLHSFDDET